MCGGKNPGFPQDKADRLAPDMSSNLRICANIPILPNVFLSFMSYSQRDHMPHYQIGTGKAVQIKPGSFLKERNLQMLFEANLEEELVVRFFGSEFTTGH